MISRLDDLPLWGRLFVALAALIAAVLLLFLASEGGQSAVPEPPPSKHDARLLEMDKIALDAAYHAQVLLLFSVWLKDDVRVTERVTNGFRIARHAYIAASERIEQREKELEQRQAK